MAVHHRWPLHSAIPLGFQMHMAEERPQALRVRSSDRCGPVLTSEALLTRHRTQAA